MTKRCYYDCPLEAAYMTKNFRIGFDTRFYACADYGSPEKFPGLHLDLRGTLPFYEGIYIAPDSLPLLEPVVGDIVKFKDNHIGRVTEMGNVEVAGNRVIGHIRPGHEWKIIQRDGKPFIWPKEEQAAGGEL